MIRVWDPLVRFFHWSLVASFAIAWLSAEEFDTLHEQAGYVAAGLIVFRLIWGLVGPRYARFAEFLKGPGTVISYFRAMVAGTEPRYLGHNPAGAVMIVVLLLGMAATAWTGWLMTLPQYARVEWVKESHEVLASGMLVLVALHVTGVFLASWRHGENLARAMITGRKRPAGPADIG